MYINIYIYNQIQEKMCSEICNHCGTNEKLEWTGWDFKNYCTKHCFYEYEEKLDNKEFYCNFCGEDCNENNYFDTIKKRRYCEKKCYDNHIKAIKKMCKNLKNYFKDEITFH